MARRNIVQTHIAEHGVQRVLLGHVLHAGADHDGQFPLPIHLARNAILEFKRRARIRNGSWRFGEKRWDVRQFELAAQGARAFLGVLQIIAAHAKDVLPRPHRRG